MVRLLRHCPHLGQATGQLAEQSAGQKQAVQIAGIHA